LELAIEQLDSKFPQDFKLPPDLFGVKESTRKKWF